MNQRRIHMNQRRIHMNEWRIHRFRSFWSYTFMKKSAILLIALFSVLLVVFAGAGCFNLKANDVTISGSATVLPLVHSIVEKYYMENKEIGISIKGGGSGTGIAELIDQSSNVAMSSREIKPQEIESAKAKGITQKEYVIAYDGITVIVHPANPVDSLTLDQLQKIYAGEIVNWKEVGGKDAAIAVISRDSASGTQEYFKEAVMKDKDFRSDMITQSATGAVIQEISQNEKAIAFIGTASQSGSIKNIGINVDGETVYPTHENILSGKYPISRALYLYTQDNPSQAVQDFIDYVLGPPGQQIVKDMGYVPL
jgi:phosphate transport system substrate-binding protein